MYCGTTVSLCVCVLAACAGGLVLDRLPRHIPSHKSRFAQDPDPPAFDASVEKRKIVQDPNQLAPLIMKPTWKAIYPFAQEGHIFSAHNSKKREAEPEVAKDEEETRHELVDILKDEDEGKEKHAKTKRQSSSSDDDQPEKMPAQEQEPPPNPDFQDWLRREYYRNMAKSFASMRRKREEPPREKRSHKKKGGGGGQVSFEEVTDSLKTIEDVLFLDALRTIQEEGYDEDEQKQRRISNDLSSAYDLETMRNALFRLRDTLGNMEQEDTPHQQRINLRKRGDQCPPLELLTSDCSSLGDIVPDGPLKRLLLHACNWHEVCYTCGEVFGLTSENCDVGFVEQSQTICRGDVPCESTASLLLLPLRQRRVFYKRSNPNVCLIDTCVQDFLRQV